MDCESLEQRGHKAAKGNLGMNNIAKLLVQSAMAALTICGFLAITLPFVLDRQDIPDHRTFLAMFVAMAISLLAYELIFKRDR